MDPETQAGTDQASLKEQARLAMLRASEGGDRSTDAEVQDDEVEAADEDESEIEAEESADEGDDEADDAGADEESDEDVESDDDAAGDERSDDASASAPKSGKRKQGKVARLHQKIEKLEAQLADRDQHISAEVEKVLAAKADADAEVQRLLAEQEEDVKRVSQVRDYVSRLRGSDQELDRLTRELASVEDLDPLALTETQRTELKKKKARLNQIISARDVYDLASEAADADLRDRVERIFSELAKDLPGVDKDFHRKLKFAPAIQHVYDAAYERGRSESATAIAKYEKRIVDLEGQLLAAKTRKPTRVGQVPEGGTPSKPAPKPKTLDQMTPLERLRAQGAIGSDGRIDPEFKKKKALGLVSLVG